MICVPQVVFSRLVARAYADGYAAHGEINLLPEAFENRLHAVTEKHIGRSSSDDELSRFFCALHTNDLYLAEACAKASDSAWWRFEMAYRRFINEVARFMSQSTDGASELAADVMASLFMPDSSGQTRIGSFDGRQSLATWLRVVISRRAINRKALKWNRVESLDPRTRLVDDASAAQIEAAIRRGRYETVFDECFKEACGNLSERERLMVLLRYEQGLRVVEIAKSLALHPSRVTRGLQSAHLKLQKKIVSVLSTKYRLGPTAIRECITEILENPAHSPLSLLKELETTAKGRSVSGRS
ncbi:MAG TPA: sigma-70 family RNA polymerase sigma factor [Blastocatellia bacterium]|nr:sigma-70 family RNA polymerase sigma factor [Blastocatellia bacterium]